MDTKLLFSSANLAGLHDQVAQDIRSNPQDFASRALFVQILCFEGAWERAEKQADALLKLDPPSALFCTSVSQLLRAENKREAVLSGQAPAAWGCSPPVWAPLHSTALSAYAAGDLEKGATHTMQILDALPAIPVDPGNGSTQPWLLDGDARLAGVMELITNDTYHLIDQAQVQSLELAAPTHPIELLWPHIRITLRNGSPLIGRMPGRYPLTPGEQDATLLMMRSTAWIPCGNHGLYLGSGQRCWNTETGLTPMLHTAKLLFR